MGKARYMRILDKVREAVAAEKVKGAYPCVRPRDLAEKLNVRESVINQACSVLVKEGVLSQWRGTTGTYSVTKPPPLPDPFEQYRQVERPPPKVSWGSKRKLLALIRTKKPWVVERWDEKRQRWFMYMEDGCNRDPSHFNVNGCTDMKPIAPEDQPDLNRNVIARWHFDFDGAIQACATVRRRRPNDIFRTRDTNAGDYIMGVIL